jgi:transposase
VFGLGMEPVVSSKSNRLSPWEYNREMYKKRNELESLFHRLKEFRRTFSRFDKLDTILSSLLTFH